MRELGEGREDRCRRGGAGQRWWGVRNASEWQVNEKKKFANAGRVKEPV